MASSNQTTCWTIIEGAAQGDEQHRQEFATRYATVIRAYLQARWRGTPLIQEVDDAEQEVFVEAFRGGGALERVDRQAPGGFRPYLYGVLRNVARRVETRRGRRRDRQPATEFLEQRPDEDEARLSQVYDRNWARIMMVQAAQRQHEFARARGDDALRRVDLLRLRFHDGLPIREIAERWGVDATHLHREYAKARKEFERALVEVVGFHCPGDEEGVRAECAMLLGVLG